MSFRRIEYIDFLKTLGLLLLILAHVDGPAFLLQLRCFDVPLMVILSGMLARNSYRRYLAKKKPEHPLFDRGYLLKRIVRLLIPTYIFLTIFFIIMATLGKTYTVRDIIYSYLLQSGSRGIGYVWIILVYLLCAFEVPFLYKLSLSSFKVIFCTIFVYITYELMAHYHIGMENFLFYSIFYYAIPYGILTLIGMNYDELPKAPKRMLFLFSMGTFFAILVLFYIKTGAVKNMAIFKYPPRIYFLSYGVFMSILLIEIASRKHLQVYDNKLVTFIGKSTLWIYLWHILFLNLFDWFGVLKCWWIRFIILVLLSCVVTFVQNAILDMLDKNNMFRSWMSVFRG